MLSNECRQAVNYILYKTNEYNKNKPFSKQIVMTTKRVQKLLYLFQAVHMKFVGCPMFEDNFKAWPSGPVISSVYYKCADTIHTVADLEFKEEYIENITDAKKVIMDCILSATNEIDTFDLVEISRAEDTPWHEIYDPENPEGEPIISKTKIFNYAQTVNFSKIKKR